MNHDATFTAMGNTLIGDEKHCRSRGHLSSLIAVPQVAGSERSGVSSTRGQRIYSQLRHCRECFAMASELSTFGCDIDIG
jgi:hypothetical protein